MPLPVRLLRDLQDLEADHRFEVVEDDNWINVLVQDVSTSALYSDASTLILIRVPRAYPDAGPDMFFTPITLTLGTGGDPASATGRIEAAGRTWRQFSWHHNRWDGSKENLRSYLTFVRRRFETA
jgi:hypothetical protein